MATAKNAKVQYEAGQSLVAFEAAVDSGDQMIFNPTNPVMSGTIDPVVRPDGVVTGVNLLSSDTVVDSVKVAAFSGNSLGALHSVAGTSVDISTMRPATNVAKVVSITMDSTGTAVGVEGTDGSDTTFVETRGAAGGPPYIPVGSVELGQVRLTSSAANIVLGSEIFQNGDYTERADFPIYEINPVGEGSLSKEAAKVNAFIAFSEALPAIHTGDLTKGVYVEYYVPSFADIARSSDFVPAETSHSLSSEEHYGGSISSSSESLGQASFKALLDDGVTDGILSKKNEVVTVKAFPDRNKPAYILTQGLIGVSRQFPIGNQINATLTISPKQASAGFSG